MMREDFFKLQKGDRVLVGHKTNPLEFVRLLIVTAPFSSGRVSFQLPNGVGTSIYHGDAEVELMTRIPNFAKLVADITELNEVARAAVIALADNEHFEELKTRYERCVNGFENIRVYIPE